MEAATSVTKKRRRRRKKKRSCAVPKRTKHTHKTKKKAPKRPLRCRKRRKKKPAPPAATPLTPIGAAPSTPQPATPAPPSPGGGTPGELPEQPPGPAGTSVNSPIAKYTGTFGIPEAERLLFRAGFGARPGEAAAFAALGLEGAVTKLTRPRGAPVLTGPAPTDGSGHHLVPYQLQGHDHAYWLDVMIRSDQQLVERMALVLHDWFATSFDGINIHSFMMDQTNLFRRFAFGSFKDLVAEVTKDPAMIVWLDLQKSRAGQVNENYARELMELFTLGADRGAYTEHDVREAARALTGWVGVMDDNVGWVSFAYDPANHDTGSKTVFGQTGAFDWTDISRMVVQNPMHPSFFVNKLWSYFIPVPPADDVRTNLEQAYVSSGYQIRPVLEAILCAPQFYSSPRMVKPPVVYHAGMMRARQHFVTRADWYWYTAMAGQRLYFPPDVSGWDDKRWLDTNTVRARWALTAQVFLGETVSSADWAAYDGTETPAQAVDRALAFWNSPTISAATRTELIAFATSFDNTTMVKAQRQNMLRQLVPCTPDYLTC